MLLLALLLLGRAPHDNYNRSIFIYIVISITVFMFILIMLYNLLFPQCFQSGKFWTDESLSFVHSFHCSRAFFASAPLPLKLDHVLSM